MLDSIPHLDGDCAALRDAARAFARKAIAPRAAAIDKANLFPADLWQAMGDAGLLGVTIEEEYGGVALGYRAHCVVMEEISRASASVGLSYGAHANLCLNQIRLHGSDAQRARYLPDLVAGRKVGALAMTEPESGSDVLAMRLDARKDGDDYILNGRKMWITNAPCADVFVVYAKTAPGKRGVSVFLLERGMKGFSTGQKLDKLGMRGSDTGELVFQDCRVPASAMMGQENRGVAVLMGGLDFERVVLAGGPLGIMAACLDVALPYARERRQFDVPIGDHQFIQGKLADMVSRLSAARSYVHAVARLCDAGIGARGQAAGAILFASEAATAAALDAIQILGANGYSNEYPAGRLLRDAKLYEIGAGTSEIRRMLLARELLASDA